MRFHILTLFPDMVEQGLSTSILGRAREGGYIDVRAVNIRDYTEDKHLHVDDYPYGGGAGMVMQPGPVVRAVRAVQEEIRARKAAETGEPAETAPEDAAQTGSAGAGANAVQADAAPADAAQPGAGFVQAETAADDGSGMRKERGARVVYLSPQGKTFTQDMAREYAKEEDLILLCGHYEGLDERAIELAVTEQVSIGDYVLTGGELAAMVMVDAISRMVPGVLSNQESGEDESFMQGVLEYPQYTRPEVFEGLSVPEVLLSGHHANIASWRRMEALRRTREHRPDMFAKLELSKQDKKLLAKLDQELREKKDGASGEVQDTQKTAQLESKRLDNRAAFIV
ncbi:MAG: tRNA (guanosine(37)-N1)-methyltransferase TrmD [Lachnospiraceae bacterium]|nr:tRNA (guanosine(37)-N1)-methyltransferase TrmD [Lachnospiraceae bacterium]